VSFLDSSEDGDFGLTVIGGLHSLAEVADLKTNYARWIPILRARFNRVAAHWDAQDPDSAAAFSKDMDALEARWAAALAIGPDQWSPSSQASQEIGRIWQSNFDPTPDPATVGAEAMYQACVHAVRQGGESMPVQTGDYLDLASRILDVETALNIPAPQAMIDPAVIQPRRSSDQSSVILQALPNPGTPTDWEHYAKMGITTVVAGITVYFLVEVMKTYRAAKEST
jgi:hypothetical protein